MAKGFFEAVGLVLLFRRHCGQTSQLTHYLVTGMVLGLTGVGLAVARERFIFTGLFDFVSGFRVTANFSGLHNGGNDLEAYIVFAQPFIFAWMILHRNFTVYMAGAVIFALSAYGLLVTFSRAGVLAMVLNWVLLTVCLVVSFYRQRKLRLNRVFLVVSFLAAGVFGVVLPIVGGPYFKARLAAARADWDYRILQSTTAIAMMNKDLQTTLWGMGLGTYPAIFYQKNPLGIKPAAYRFEMNNDNLFLRLLPGSPLYFGQWLGIGAADKLSIALSLRATERGTVNVYLCEKTLQYSFRCATHRFDVDASESWTERKAELDIDQAGLGIARRNWLVRRPIELALSNTSRTGSIDIDNVRLFNGRGNNIIMNGDFSRGMDRWFFTVDNLVPWQAANQWVQLYLEQGWSGIVSFMGFVAWVLWRLLQQTFSGDWLRGIVFAALVSFLFIGLFGFLFDTPRMAMMFFLVSFVFAGNDKVPTAT
jgi:O-antigen ligase